MVFLVLDRVDRGFVADRSAQFGDTDHAHRADPEVVVDPVLSQGDGRAVSVSCLELEQAAEIGRHEDADSVGREPTGGEQP